MDIELSDAFKNLPEDQRKTLSAQLQSELADTVQGVQAAAATNLKEVSKVKVEVAKSKDTEKVITI